MGWCISCLKKTSPPPRAAASEAFPVVASVVVLPERASPPLLPAETSTPSTASAEASKEAKDVVEAPKRALPQLPPEIWRQVLSFYRLPFATLLTLQDPALETSPHYSDLVRFALVNSTFAELVKPVLYERLHYLELKSETNWQPRFAGIPPPLITTKTKGKPTPFLRDLTVVGARQGGVETEVLQNEIIPNCYSNLTHLKLCGVTKLEWSAFSFPNLQSLTLMDTAHGVCTLIGGAPRLRHLGVLHGGGLPGSTPPLHELCPSLVSLAIGFEPIYATEDQETGSSLQRLQGAAYIEATDRLFGSLCSTLRHLALDGHAGNLAAWEPLLQKCGLLRFLRIYNIGEQSLPIIRRLDLPSISLLHLDVLNPRHMPGEDQDGYRVADVVESCFELLSEAIQGGRFANLKTYVGGITNDFNYPQRRTNMTFAKVVVRPNERVAIGYGSGHRDLVAFTRRDEWDPLGVESQLKLLGV
ncbi:hypothetical protein BCR35DRAFT_305396 [Leucosporidium creatinivorum]|uniref:Uncharacterized protein n=1 Tax=Leucosporidium creatinivorum TaxID=106004 RepID=A0A1Y2F154_9BASI|nr:hypothetical protein BCR35DRAFT_305396 [Leucosporidium creatinivorum]